MTPKDIVRRVTRPLGFDIVKYRTAPADASAVDVAVIDFVRPYTMTPPERVYALCLATRYIVRAKIDGAVVECGVWRGGSAMAAARVLLEEGDGGRPLYLYDTFEGMPRPTAADRDVYGHPASDRFERLRTGEDRSGWDRASIEDVRANVGLTGYDPTQITYIQGKVEETIPRSPDGVEPPNQVALLRLDTDWYESTKHELVHLFPRLAPGGVLIVDDYGHWQGSRKAVDEYFTETGQPILLNRIDYSGRIAVKLG